jgi:hypothetical protein
MPRKTRKEKEKAAERKKEFGTQPKAPRIPAPKAVQAERTEPSFKVIIPDRHSTPATVPVPATAPAARKDASQDRQAREFFRKDISKSAYVIAGILALEVVLYVTAQAGYLPWLLAR